MSRNSYRGLTFVLILIASLGMVLPASAAGPAERIPATQDSLLARLWDWVGSLWQIAVEPRQDLQPVTAAAGICDPDRGALIDPNGNPCNK